MAFKPYKGAFVYKWAPKKASTALSEGAVIDVIDGYVEVCAIARQSHSGVCQKPVASTDSDYASTTLIPYLAPKSPDAEWIASVLSSDTAVATDVGNFFDLGGSPVGIDTTRATSDDDAFLVTRFIGANVVCGNLNSFKPMKNGIGTAV